jgi:hypothetical protein
MKLQNWLIFTFAKSVLFFAAVLSAIVIPVEIFTLFTDKTLTFESAAGFPLKVTPENLGFGYDRVMLLVPAILIVASIAYACWQFGMILHSVENNKEFLPRNYKRLLHAGASVIFADLLLLVFDILNNNVVRGILHVSPAKPIGLTNGENSFSFPWLLVGCIFMILAKVFKRGAELEEIHELTA